ncbi:hypothetical protein SLEP1_g18600 [Rubroshorea leprosula]|uniref:Uncharacterized protein n=1 Tax=Rubroshorea leprosula TaxID=152421 RepID=A0AAV5IY35_9ROSI|nr:hypothetical protein SLEP1_g18600 [Rubroshorea leprosula]
MRKLRLQFDDLKNTKEELGEENESFKSEITALEQKIERRRKLKINAHIPLPSPKEGLAINKLITWYRTFTS